MGKTLRTLSLLALPWVVVAAFRTVPQEQQTQQQTDEPATKIEKGVKSESQKTHGKVYDSWYPKRGGRLDVAPKDKRVRDFQANMYNPPGLGHVVEPMPALQFLNLQSCRADAVIVGKVIAKDSQLLESAQFLFTEYKIVVETVYKNNPQSPIALSSEVTVIRPGGKVEIDGRIVKIIDGSFLPLPLQKRVLLFLKFLPETGSYDSAINRGSFMIEQGRLVPLTDQVVSGFDQNNPVEWTGEIKSAFTVNCFD